MFVHPFKVAFSVVVTSLAIATFAADDVKAAPPEAAEGSFSVDAIEVISVNPSGEVCLIELEATFSLEGTFEGTLTADFFIIHLGACDQPAPEIFVAEGIYVGSVDGASGAFEFSFVGTIDAEGNADGDLVIRSGTEELTNLSGTLTLTGVTGVGGVYEGEFHFAP